MTTEALIKACEDAIIEHAGKPDDALAFTLVANKPARGPVRMQVLEQREDGSVVYGCTLGQVKRLLARVRAVQAAAAEDAQ